MIKLGSKGEEVKQLQKALGITVDGIFGTQTEKAVKEFQKSKGLDVDGIVGNKTWQALGSVGITYNPINTHISKASRDIKYLVIHYTAGSTSSKGAAQSTRGVFLKREASADFVVDDHEIVQINPDLKNYYCWAVGDGNGKYGVTNKNSISIEMCSSLKKGTSNKVPNHSGWYFTQEVQDNTVKLAK